MEHFGLYQFTQIKGIPFNLPARALHLKILAEKKSSLIPPKPFITMADNISSPMLGLYGEDPFGGEQNVVYIAS